MGLLVINYIKKNITIPLKHTFHKKCIDCNTGYVILDRLDYINNTEVNVYKCNYCNKEFV